MNLHRISRPVLLLIGFHLDVQPALLIVVPQRILLHPVQVPAVKIGSHQHKVWQIVLLHHQRIAVLGKDAGGQNLILHHRIEHSAGILLLDIVAVDTQRNLLSHRDRIGRPIIVVGARDEVVDGIPPLSANLFRTAAHHNLLPIAAIQTNTIGDSDAVLFLREIIFQHQRPVHRQLARIKLLGLALVPSVVNCLLVDWIVVGANHFVFIPAAFQLQRHLDCSWGNTAIKQFLPVWYFLKQALRVQCSRVDHQILPLRLSAYAVPGGDKVDITPRLHLHILFIGAAHHQVGTAALPAERVLPRNDGGSHLPFSLVVQGDIFIRDVQIIALRAHPSSADRRAVKILRADKEGQLLIQRIIFLLWLHRKDVGRFNIVANLQILRLVDSSFRILNPQRIRALLHAVKRQFSSKETFAVHCDLLAVQALQVGCHRFRHRITLVARIDISPKMDGIAGPIDGAVGVKHAVVTFVHWDLNLFPQLHLLKMNFLSILQHRQIGLAHLAGLQSHQALLVSLSLHRLAGTDIAQLHCLLCQRLTGFGVVEPNQDAAVHRLCIDRDVSDLHKLLHPVLWPVCIFEIHQVPALR